MITRSKGVETTGPGAERYRLVEPDPSRLVALWRAVEPRLWRAALIAAVLFRDEIRRLIW